MDSKTQCKESVKRRIRAGRLLLKGMPQAEVGLRGRPRSLDKTDLHELKRVLLKGALASGFAAVKRHPDLRVKATPIFTHLSCWLHGTDQVFKETACSRSRSR